MATYPKTVMRLSSDKQVKSGRKEKAAMGRRFFGGRLLCGWACVRDASLSR